MYYEGNVQDKQNDDCWLHHALAPSKNRRSRPALVGADDDAAATATATDVIIVIVIELIIIVFDITKQKSLKEIRGEQSCGIEKKKWEGGGK